MARNRLLYFTRTFYHDSTNGAATASRDLLRLLARRGMASEVVSGSMIDGGVEIEVPEALARLGVPFDIQDGIPPHVRIESRGSDIAIPLRDPRSRGDCCEFDPDPLIRLVEMAFERFRPDVLLTYGGDEVTREVLGRARRRGIATVFALHNFLYRQVPDCDAIFVASRFSRDFHREALGVEADRLPYLVDFDRACCERRQPGYLTFVNPSSEKGVYAFARIADELGKRRLDIPILVVESRGTEATVAACGLELREHGNVFFMGHTHDPRDFWGVTKVCLLPSLWWENQPLVAVEAMVNGIPVIGSDRGGIPETLGQAGIVLPLPDRITQATRMLPTAEEVEPWVRAVIRLWDDADFYEDHRRRALAEARRWDPEVLEPQYVEFFRNLKPGSRPEPGIPPGRAKAVVLVPHLNGVDWECEQSLRKLEEEGVRVVRSGGSSSIDVARNRLASEALHDGAESILFVDSDLGFDPLDALRLLARPEPGVSGVYAKKGRRQFASVFADGVEEVVFGSHAFGLYPLKYAATGFLRIKASVLRRMIAELDLPHCNRTWGRGEWPFFQPTVVPQGEGEHHYLGEDWAFSHRLALIGVTPMADTSIRLWHYGRHPFGWEDAGAESKRFATFTYRLGGREG